MDDPWDDDIDVLPAFPDQLELLREAVSQRDPELLDGLGEMDDEVAVALIGVLEDEAVDPAVRAEAAVAAGPTLELCDDELVDGRLVDGPYGAPLSDEVYRRLLDVLHHLATDPTVPKLLRRRALEGSVRSPQPWHEPLIRELWASEDVELRVTAVFGMGFLYRVDLSSSIEQALDAPEEELRAEAILAAARRGLKRLAPVFADLAASSETPRQLRCAAIQALGMVGRERDASLLSTLVGDEDETASALARNALEELELFSDLPDLDDLDDDLYDDEDELEGAPS